MKIYPCDNCKNKSWKCWIRGCEKYGKWHKSLEKDLE